MANKNRDIGYNYSNLVISESGKNNYLGLGTYFVSSPQDMGGSYLESMQSPMKVVDFSKYKLFKPKSYEESLVLSNCLEAIDNGNLSPVFLEKPISTVDTNNLVGREFSEYPEDQLDKDLLYIDTLTDFLDGFDVEYDDEIDRTNTYDVEVLIYDLEELVTDTINLLEESAITQQEVIDTLAAVFDITELEVISSLVKILIDSKNQYENSANFVKDLGYDGIDVRDFNQATGNLDTIDLGSVIYDIDKDTILK